MWVSVVRTNWRELVALWWSIRLIELITANFQDSTLPFYNTSLTLIVLTQMYGSVGKKSLAYSIMREFRLLRPFSEFDVIADLRDLSLDRSILDDELNDEETANGLFLFPGHEMNLFSEEMLLPDITKEGVERISKMVDSTVLSER